MSAELNLSRRPFLNPRPVLRLTILLWAAGLVVAALNVRLYWSHFSGSSETREQQETLAASIESEQGQVKKLRASLAGYDLSWQNDQSAFLNNKIAERSFSWSQLFDRLGEVLPADARVSSLSPEFSRARRRGRSDPAENEIQLSIRGIAKSSAVVLEFIDSLFAHASFRNPNLTSESLKDTGLLDFNLSVIYEARPALPETPPEETVAEEAADEAEMTAASEASEGATDARAEAEEEAGAEAEDGTGVGTGTGTVTRGDAELPADASEEPETAAETAPEATTP